MALVSCKSDEVVLQLVFQCAYLLVLKYKKALVRLDLVLKLLHPDITVWDVLQNLLVRSGELASFKTASERQFSGVLLDVVLLCCIVDFLAATRAENAFVLGRLAEGERYVRRHARAHAISVERRRELVLYIILFQTLPTEDASTVQFHRLRHHLSALFAPESGQLSALLFIRRAVFVPGDNYFQRAIRKRYFVRVNVRNWVVYLQQSLYFYF